MEQDQRHRGLKKLWPGSFNFTTDSCKFFNNN